MNTKDKHSEYNGGNKTATGRITIILAIILGLAFVVLMIPFVQISRYAYPFADDFSYGAYARIAFKSTGSVIKAVSGAFRQMIDTYQTWQGTYTSTFLMALQPAVFGVELYHLTGAIMVLAVLLSYAALVHVFFSKILDTSLATRCVIFISTSLLTLEGVYEGGAEALTWYNSAVHYTFGHALLILFIALFLDCFFCPDQHKHPKVFYVLACLVGFLAAGTNNVTVFGGLLLLAIFAISVLLYEKIYGEKDYSLFTHAIPMICVYVIGAAINLGAVGNKVRMSAMGNENSGFILTVRNSYLLGSEFIHRHFNLVVLGYLVIVAAAIWNTISNENALDKVKFRFPLPGVITFLSFSILSALYAPFAYLDKVEKIDIAFYNANLSVARVANCVWYAMVLLILLNVIYYCGWIHSKGAKGMNIAVYSVVLVAAIILITASAANLVNKSHGTFLTSAAVHSLNNDTAAYYGYQMAVNTQILESEERSVEVSPLAVDPYCLYPHDASDWKEGTGLFYDKDSVEYDSEPYVFN